MSYFGIPMRNGLPLGLGSVAPLASGGGSPFSPLSLFSGGTPGAWYDPSDYGATGTLFQDSAGTTPVTAVEQPVGLMLDKSQGLVLGSELVVNGNFTSNSDWTLTASATISGGVLNVTSALFENFATQGSSGVIGKWYLISLDATVTSGAFGVFVAQVTAGNKLFGNNVTTSGRKTGYVYCSSASTSFTVILRSEGSFVGTIDNISVKELPGNHAFQATSASRPVLSARYNLLTKTEQFDDAAWTKNSATVAANGSAWRITDATVVASANIQQSVTVVANTPHTFQLEFEKQASGIFAIAIGNFFCYVNHATLATFNETSFAGVNPSSSVALVSGTQYRLTCTVTLASAGSNVRIFAALATMSGDVNGGSNPAATGFLDVYKADFRVTNNGITQPAYQRVNTATDYDTTGFLPYLKFDGVDDSLSTNSISFTATDKMSVFAGVRKLSDAGYAALLELSNSYDANTGTITVGYTSSFIFGSKGTVGQIASATALAPTSAVLTGLGDISGDRATLRLNGTQVAQNTGDQGTGNYGNYPLYIGRRGGSSSPYNGQMYSMIIVGKAVTAGELSSTETYTASKTGVVLA